MGYHVDWVVSHMGWAGFLRDRNGPTNVISEFLSNLRAVYFMSVFDRECFGILNGV